MKRIRVVMAVVGALVLAVACGVPSGSGDAGGSGIRGGDPAGG